MFPRYGSYPGFQPIVELSTTFHTQVVGTNSQRQAMFIERVEGLAEVILANFNLQLPDVMMVFSAGGVGSELHRDGDRCQAARLAGDRRDVTCPVECGAAAALVRNPAIRPCRCGDRPVHATGDALVVVEGLESSVVPGSSIAAIAVVNETKVRTAQRLVERGAMPPVLTSPSVIGAQRSAELFDAANREHARRAAAVVAGADLIDGPRPDWKTQREGRQT